MKIEQSKIKTFQPVTITLESVEEVAFLAALIGGTNDEDEKHICGKSVCGLAAYRKLDNICEDYGFERGRVEVSIV